MWVSGAAVWGCWGVGGVGGVGVGGLGCVWGGCVWGGGGVMHASWMCFSKRRRSKFPVVCERFLKKSTRYY